MAGVTMMATFMMASLFYFGFSVMFSENGYGAGKHPLDASHLLHIQTNVVSTRGKIGVSWDLSKNEVGNRDWVGLYRFGPRTKGTQALAIQKTEGITAGFLEFEAPSEPGYYQFQYYTQSLASGSDSIKKGESESFLAIQCNPHPIAKSNIQHVILIVQENHTFDSIFAKYCKAPAGSNPTCNIGPECCEAGPTHDPGLGIPPFELTDARNARYSPIHTYACEVSEMNGGKMDHFLIFAACGNWLENFSYAEASTVLPYWNLASNSALADRYFQPIAGASSSNDMYFARAGYVFTDNEYFPYNVVGKDCHIGTQRDFNEPNLGDMLRACGVPFSVYAGGYSAMKSAQGGCPAKPKDCAGLGTGYPCNYDPSDVPFQYYRNLRDHASFMKDLDEDFDRELKDGKLPAFSYLKLIGYKSEHPGNGVIISDGVKAASAIIEKVLQSPHYKENTLILFTYDEGGGYFDHVAPPPVSIIDHKPYGTRVPLLAIGNFAKRNYISHITMEHSSVVKFIEWNWFPGNPGQLEMRDSVVNNIGSLLDFEKVGIEVPQ